MKSAQTLLRKAMILIAVSCTSIISVGCATLNSSAQLTAQGHVMLVEAAIESSSDLARCGSLSMSELKEQQAKGCYLNW